MLLEHSLNPMLLIPNKCFPPLKIDTLQLYGSSANVAWYNLSVHVRKSISEHGNLSNCGIGWLITRFPNRLYPLILDFTSIILIFETSGSWFASCTMYTKLPMVLKTWNLDRNYFIENTLNCYDIINHIISVHEYFNMFESKK